jgi:ribosomal peptide maturation radical SAM protein 1
MNYRSMSSEKAIAQFQELFGYADKCKQLESVDNILPKSYIKDVFPNINTPPGIKIFYEVKADLSEEDIRVLANAGVHKIQPGIESLATSTLKLMRKGTNVFINLKLLKNCVVYNIDPIWNLLIGFPGEEDDVYKKYLVDLPLLFHLPPPNGAFPVRFDRYSPYYVQAEQYKLDLRPLDFYELIYPLGKEQLANLAYYFSDSNLNSPYLVTMVRWISKLEEKVKSWRLRWRNNDGRNRPKLCFKKYSEALVVFDSRSDRPVEHKISEISYQILKFLDKPQRISDVAAKIPANPGFNIESEVSFLQENGLVFQEGERYMNIVLPEMEYGLSQSYSCS